MFTPEQRRFAILSFLFHSFCTTLASTGFLLWCCICCRECIPSGALTLDIALGGGFPKGRIVEVLFLPAKTSNRMSSIYTCYSARPHDDPTCQSL